MLYSEVLSVEIAGGFMTALGLYRFLTDWKSSDAIDVLLLLFAGLMDVIAGIGLIDSDFINSAGAILPYNGDWPLALIFIPMGLICLFMMLFAGIVTMTNFRKAREQRF